MSDTRDRANRYVWNPMTRMADVLGRQRVWVRGEGSTLFDEEGRAYLDGCGSLWYANVGYGRQEIVDAVARQMELLPAWMLFGPNVTVPTVDLAERLAGLTPGDCNRIYFTCGGSESVEIALKIARQYHRLVGSHGRVKVIARRGSYHGSTLGALSATGTPHNRRMFEPLVPGFRHVDPFSLEALEAAVELESPETVAAILVEPASAASGLRFPPDGYLPGVRELCDRHGILLVADEVICGFGRTGTWFGVDHWGVVPDLVTMAKGLSSGYVPLGAVAVADRVFAPFAEDREDAGFFSGNTYAGHAASCAGALENVAILEREELVERSAREGRYLHDLLAPLADDFDAVREVRGGRGLVAAVELESPVAAAVAERAYDRGVLVRALTAETITLSPPLVVARDELERIVEALRGALGGVQDRRGPAVTVPAGVKGGGMA
jgi:putrescine aminotransferase